MELDDFNTSAPRVAGAGIGGCWWEGANPDFNIVLMDETGLQGIMNTWRDGLKS